jgi:hypothetical protein
MSRATLSAPNYLCRLYSYLKIGWHRALAPQLNKTALTRGEQLLFAQFDNISAAQHRSLRPVASTSEHNKLGEQFYH